jgi:hypothetical protein
MAVDARLNQIALEIIVNPQPSARVQQAVIELILIPGNLPPIGPTLPVKITLRGAKLVPVGGKQPIDCEVPEPGHVKRAV